MIILEAVAGVGEEGAAATRSSDQPVKRLCQVVGFTNTLARHNLDSIRHLQTLPHFLVTHQSTSSTAFLRSLEEQYPDSGLVHLPLYPLSYRLSGAIRSTNTDVRPPVLAMRHPSLSNRCRLQGEGWGRGLGCLPNHPVCHRPRTSILNLQPRLRGTTIGRTVTTTIDSTGSPIVLNQNDDRTLSNDSKVLLARPSVSFLFSEETKLIAQEKVCETPATSQDSFTPRMDSSDELTISSSSPETQIERIVSCDTRNSSDEEYLIIALNCRKFDHLSLWAVVSQSPFAYSLKVYTILWNHYSLPRPIINISGYINESSTNEQFWYIFI